MDLEPKTLGVPLYKKNWSPFWFAVACVGLGPLAIRPSSASEWIVALGIVGPTFWISFGGPSFVYRWQQHAVPIVRGFVVLLRVAFAAIVLWYIAPFIASVIDGALHA